MADMSCKDCIFYDRSPSEYPCVKCQGFDRFVPSNSENASLLEEVNSLKEKVNILEDRINNFGCDVCPCCNLKTRP
jgi:hypothetical protein